MSSLEKLYPGFRGQLVVSCHTWDDDAFRDPSCMARFARAAVDGGAAGIRADSPEEIKAIREAVNVPIIGIFKVKHDDGKILITPSFESAQRSRRWRRPKRVPRASRDPRADKKMESRLVVGLLLAAMSGLMNGSFTLPMRFLGRWE